MRPLLLVDVDGPLHPFAARTPPEGYVEHRWRLSRWSRTVQRAWLNPTHGPALLDLAARTGAELAWATTWEHRANTTVGPALGLPPLPVVGVRAYEGGRDRKFGAVGRFARGRPLAWLDDDFDLFPAAATPSSLAAGTRRSSARSTRPPAWAQTTSPPWKQPFRPFVHNFGKS